MSGYRAGVPRAAGRCACLGWLWRLFVPGRVQLRAAAVAGLAGLAAARSAGCLARILFGLRYHDVACPFRLFRRDILARIPIQSDGPFAHVELLAKANFLGCLMGEEVPLDVAAGRTRATGRSCGRTPAASTARTSARPCCPT